MVPSHNERGAKGTTVILPSSLCLFGQVTMLLEGGGSQFGSRLAALFHISLISAISGINLREFRVCGALLVYLLACACSVFLNAGRLSATSSQWVLIVLDLSCCGNGYKLQARATPVDDGRPRTAIWLNPGVVPPPSPAVGHRLVCVNGCICFGSATPTCMGDHKSLEAGGALVEEELKWKWLR